jgi:hypothetical protein
MNTIVYCIVGTVLYYTVHNIMLFWIDCFALHRVLFCTILYSTGYCAAEVGTYDNMKSVKHIFGNPV